MRFIQNFFRYGDPTKLRLTAQRIHAQHNSCEGIVARSVTDHPSEMRQLRPRALRPVKGFTNRCASLLVGGVQQHLLTRHSCHASFYLYNHDHRLLRVYDRDMFTMGGSTDKDKSPVLNQEAAYAERLQLVQDIKYRDGDIEVFKSGWLLHSHTQFNELIIHYLPCAVAGVAVNLEIPQAMQQLPSSINQLNSTQFWHLTSTLKTLFDVIYSKIELEHINHCAIPIMYYHEKQLHEYDFSEVQLVQLYQIRTMILDDAKFHAMLADTSNGMWALADAFRNIAEQLPTAGSLTLDKAAEWVAGRPAAYTSGLVARVAGFAPPSRCR
tara:strand:+ start:51565 stop:52539 length:975 start_codon:yes stop_codon:yes gene_type:complete